MNADEYTSLRTFRNELRDEYNKTGSYLHRRGLLSKIKQLDKLLSEYELSKKDNGK